MQKLKKGMILTITAAAGITAAVAISLFPPPETAGSVFPLNKRYINEAMWWRPACNGVQCSLCPFECFLPEGKRGRCKVRINSGGRLKTLVYGQPVSAHVDPIEKKPVYHMLPGSGIFSIATVGCNLRCDFCQNWSISQVYPEQTGKLPLISPQRIVDEAVKAGCRSIAYTYSEPVIFYEYVLETARLAKRSGLRNVMVSAGYINPEPLKAIAKYFDVVKIDLKGFNEGFYKDVIGGDLKVVKETLITLKKESVLIEVVNLVVPTLNDDMNEIRKMCQWIFDNLGADTPLFFSRFTPQYQLANLPPTPIETLEEARRIAMEEIGLRYVYIGNVPGNPGENTYCPKCHNIIIRRYGYDILDYDLEGDRCEFCGEKIPGIWR
ncbi:MAG: AmmeMemoRadiSam system radical SAM enzyme [Candidatus Omnitrophota bacterium]